MRFRRRTTRWRFGGLTALTLVLALVMQLAFPFRAFSASPDLPRPGERLAEGRLGDAGRGITAQIMDGHDGARIVTFSLDFFAAIDRFEAIIYGDAVEFYGEAVLIYANGHRTYPVRELFADGERLTFFVERSHGTTAELYVQFRLVRGQNDSVLYVIEMDINGNRVGISSADDFFIAGNMGSPYQPSREIGTGSISSIFTSPIGTHGTPRERFGSSFNVRTTPVARPNQTPAPDPTPPPTDPPVQPTPTPTPTPTPEPTPTPTEPPVQPVVVRFVDGNTIYTINGAGFALDAAPFRTGGRFMVPLRAVAEALGASAEWVGGERPVEIRSDTNVIQLAIGVALYDSGGAYMGTPVIVNNRTFVPLRFVAEHFAAEVRWDGDALAAYVYR